MNVTIVGAGVVGLTAAVTLAEAGHAATVVAAATGDATTSALAGAIWFPFHVGPADAVARWAARTRTWLEALAASEPAAGVALVDVIALDDDPAPAWAAVVAPVTRTETELGTAWRYRVPRIDPRRHLAWLERRLATPVRRAVVTSLADLAGDVVVNATGLGARELAADGTVYGLLGQTVVVAPGGLALDRAIFDERAQLAEPTALFYAIPREDELVLGGCAVHADAMAPPDPAIRARILAHAAALGLAPGPVRCEHVGLRPGRPTVRVERDPVDRRVVHCYGHGGAGFTLARGCAEDVVELIDQARVSR